MHYLVYAVMKLTDHHSYGHHFFSSGLHHNTVQWEDLYKKRERKKTPQNNILLIGYKNPRKHILIFFLVRNVDVVCNFCLQSIVCPYHQIQRYWKCGYLLSDSDLNI